MNNLFQRVLDIAIQGDNADAWLSDACLRLALRGQLGTASRDDVPAGTLLEEIDAEWERLAEAGLAKKPRASHSQPQVVPYSLPIGWEWAPLSRLFYPISVGKNKILSSEVCQAGRYPVVDQGQREIAGYSEREDRLIRLPGPVVVFGDHTCELKYIDFDFVAGADGVKILRPIVINPRYFYLVLQSLEVKTDRYTRHYKMLLDNVVPVAPQAEQERIVERIEQIRRSAESLRTQRQIVQECRSLFGVTASSALASSNGIVLDATQRQALVQNHFDDLTCDVSSLMPIRGAVLEMAFRGLLTDGQDVGNIDELVAQIRQTKIEVCGQGRVPVKANAEAEPFRLPQNWRWVTLDDITERVTKGSSPRWQGVNYVKQGGILFITSENVRNVVLDLSDPKFVEERFNQIEPRSILRRGDLLMNIVGASIGRVALYDRDDVANVNQAVCVIRLLPLDGLVDPRYILYYLNSPTCISVMFAKQVNMARANLSMGNIRRFHVPLPTLAVQQKIVALLDRFAESFEALESEMLETQAKRREIMQFALDTIATLTMSSGS